MGAAKKERVGAVPGGVSRQKESLNGGLSLVSTHVQRESDAMRASEQLDYLFGDERGEISSEIWVLTNAGKRWRRRLTKRWRG